MSPEGAAILILLIGSSLCGCLVGSLCLFCCCISSLWKGFYQLIFKPSLAQKSFLQGDNQGMEHAFSAPYAYASMSSGEDVPVVEAFVLPPLAQQQYSGRSNGASAGASIQPGTSSITNQGQTQSPPTYGVKDVWAAVLFLTNVLVIVVLAVVASVHYSRMSSANAEEDFKGINVTQVVLFLLLLVLLISSMASGVLYMLLRNALNIIDMTMRLNIAGLTALALLSLFTANILGAIIFAVFAGLNYWYYISVQDRIPFASSILSTACTAVLKHFAGLLTVAYSGLLFQVIWLFVWSIAALGVYQTFTDNNGGDQQGLNGLVGFLLLLSLLWGLQCIKDVVSVTAGGTVACWWFQPNNPSPVTGSIFRATTTSFGSICFGSLLLAFITSLKEVIRGILKNSRQNRRERNIVRECFLAILESLLRLLEQGVAYINRFAYSYVAAYGHDFISSGRMVMAMFSHRGWTAIINDQLISNALWLLVVFLSILGGLIGVILSLFLAVYNGKLSDSDQLNAVLLTGFFSGIMTGFIIGGLISSMLDAATAMVFVCFGEDAHTLSVNHPSTYSELHGRWSQFNPETLPNATVESLPGPFGRAVPGSFDGIEAGPCAVPYYDYGAAEYKTAAHDVSGGSKVTATASAVQYTNPPPFNPDSHKAAQFRSNY